MLDNLQTKCLAGFFHTDSHSTALCEKRFLGFLQLKSFLITLMAYLCSVQFIDSIAKVEKYIKLTVSFGLFSQSWGS
jgi:hypothetical protein